MGKKIDAFLAELKKQGDGRWSYYNDRTGKGIGCSDYVEMCLKNVGIINSNEELWAAKGILGPLADTKRFQKLAWGTALQGGDILWSHGHHVAVWAGDAYKSLYEAAPESTHSLATCGTGVGLHQGHTEYNCGTGTKTWTCIYRIVEDNNNEEDTKMAKISSLATTKHLTDKHWEARNASSVKYIIPHHMAGRMTGDACAQYFVTNGLENSANYCIGYNGDISCNVSEEYGAWTSSFGKVDKCAITMEISDTASPTNWSTLAGADWHIPQKAQDAFVNLCVDLFKRYPSLGGKMIYDPSDAAKVAQAKKNNVAPTGLKGNVLLHEWTSNYGTSCPEWHMKEILPSLVKKVNEKLGASTATQTTSTTTKAYTKRELALQCIQGKWGNGADRVNKLTAYIKEYKLTFTAADVQKDIDLMLVKTGYTLKVDDVIKAMVADGSIPTLKNGSKGELVKVLQTWLKKAGYMDGSIDGSFGPVTETAVKALQTNLKAVYGNAYKVDGIIGPVYWKKLLGM